MELQTKRIGKALVIYLEGKFDLQLSMDVEKQINEILARGEKYLIFELSEVKYISSSGLRIFIQTMRELKNKDGAMRIAGMTEKIKKFFEVVGLLELLKFCDTIEDASQELENL